VVGCGMERRRARVGGDGERKKKRLTEEKFFGGWSVRPGNAIRLMNRNNSRAIVLFGSFQLTAAPVAPNRAELGQAEPSRTAAKQTPNGATRSTALSFYAARTRPAARNYNFLSGGELTRAYACGDRFLFFPFPLFSFSLRIFTLVSFVLFLGVYGNILRFLNTRAFPCNESVVLCVP